MKEVDNVRRIFSTRYMQVSWKESDVSIKNQLLRFVFLGKYRLVKLLKKNTSLSFSTSFGNNTRFGCCCEFNNSSLGNNCTIGNMTKVTDSTLRDFIIIGDYSRVTNTTIGDHSYTGEYCVVEFSKINKFCSIAWGVTIGPAEHDYNKITTHEFLYNPFHKLSKEIFYDTHQSGCNIGNDVWIGTNSIILQGVTVCDGAVVAANSVVTRNVPPYAIVAGTPAKVIKYRFSEDVINKLLKIAWWDISDDLIANNIHLFAREPDEVVLDELLKIKKMTTIY